MATNDPATEQLLDLASQQDASAVAQLMALHRTRVRKMVAVRMDPRIMPRVDPSDVVQETLIEAADRLPLYLEQKPIAFYPWLRGIAIQRLIQLHRRHVLAKHRSVLQEEPGRFRLPDESTNDLAQRLVQSGTSPSRQLERTEARRHVKDALNGLEYEDREVLVLKYLEELTALEISDVLGVTERTVWRRHSRALARLGEVLGDCSER